VSFGFFSPVSVGELCLFLSVNGENNHDESCICGGV